MADDNVVNIRHSHIDEAIARLREIRHERGFKQLVILGITDNEDSIQLMAHDNDPRPHQMLGVMRDSEHAFISWLKRWEVQAEDPDLGA